MYRHTYLHLASYHFVSTNCAAASLLIHGTFNVTHDRLTAHCEKCDAGKSPFPLPRVKTLLPLALGGTLMASPHLPHPRWHSMAAMHVPQIAGDMEGGGFARGHGTHATQAPGHNKSD